MPFFDGPPPSNTVPIYFVTRETWPDIATELPIAAAQFATSSKFEPTPGACLILPDADGRIASVLFGLEAASVPYRDPFLPGKLVAALPAGVYRFANAPHDTPLAVLAWATLLSRTLVRGWRL